MRKWQTFQHFFKKIVVFPNEIIKNKDNKKKVILENKLLSESYTIVYRDI